MTRSLLLAVASGAPALVYQVLWTRQLELAIGAQAPAVAVVVATFFAGLAAGAWTFGGRADRSRHPLRLFAALEAGGALAALGAFAALGALDARTAPAALRLPLAALAIGPATFLLGGSLPALLRGVAGETSPAGHAGALVAAHTTGAVLGVLAAAFGAPTLGLVATARAAAAWGLGVAATAVALSRERPPGAAPRGERARPPLPLLGAAALAGATTLAFEVLATRAASLRLGSSLVAWAFVLASFLVALAAGNALAARASVRAANAARWLGALEIGVGCALLGAFALLGHEPTRAAAGLGLGSGIAVALAILPAVVGMGAAFPFFVRLAAPDATAVGARFGALSAANTAGGIAGSLLAPFVLLPAFGLDGALLACTVGAGLLGLAFLALGAAPGARLRDLGLGAALLGAVAFGVLPRGSGPRPLFAAHDAQASVAVVHAAGMRQLYVDGDPEAAARGAARETEEWLGLLPFALHPGPARVLEIGLGSGITLGTVARLPVEHLVCVEIAPAVPRAAAYFAPENGGIVARARAEAGVTIEIGDGRAFLLDPGERFDVILANTIRPGSVGATGLYSWEYFERVRRALAPGGVAAQWLPLELPERAFHALLHTFYDVFPHGAIWWGAGNVVLVGAEAPLPEPGAAAFEVLREGAPDALVRLGIASLADLRARRLADAGDVRAAVADAERLVDDRPRLELWTARHRSDDDPAGALQALASIASAVAERDPARAPLADFVRSRAARALGEVRAADALEARAERAGLTVARTARLDRLRASAGRQFREERLAEAEAAYRALLAEAPGDAATRFGLAATRYRQGDAEGARELLEALVRETPAHPEAWNLLGALRAEAGAADDARSAFDRALAADPWYAEAARNALRLAEQRGDRLGAERYARRLREITGER